MASSFSQPRTAIFPLIVAALALSAPGVSCSKSDEDADWWDDEYEEEDWWDDDGLEQEIDSSEMVENQLLTKGTARILDEKGVVHELTFEDWELVGDETDAYDNELIIVDKTAGDLKRTVGFDDDMSRFWLTDDVNEVEIAMTEDGTFTIDGVPITHSESVDIDGMSFDETNAEALLEAEEVIKSTPAPVLQLIGKFIDAGGS